MELNQCPMCNSPVEMDSTAAAEYGGHAWQTITIECTNPKCSVYISHDGDHYYFKDSWNNLIEHWNKITSK